MFFFKPSIRELTMVGKELASEYGVDYRWPNGLHGMDQFRHIIFILCVAWLS